jgi:UDPglucose--hexose-1-phosphate uridylyltransferase
MPAARIWKTAAQLADGRQITYYDESQDAGRAGVPDQRDLAGLAPAGKAGELRYDALLGDWIAYAEHRQERTFLPSAEHCPLCPSTAGRTTEIPAADYDVAVFENRFPALPSGQGRCEVVCFTSDHDASFAQLSPRRVQTVMSVWADRTAELGSADGVKHVYCFENRGVEVGVTLSHPHGQIYAVPFVPPRTRQLLASAQAHRERAGKNLFDDLLATEIADGRRIIARNDDWVAFVPVAARWPFEVLVFPAQRVLDLAGLSSAAQASFAAVYLDVLRRLDALFGVPMPYLAAWQQAPVPGTAARDEMGLHLQVMTLRRAPGKLKYLAGTESGAGIWSNDVLPETAARRLREAV